MKPLLDFDDAGASDDEPAKGVTVGDIRAWHDEHERLHDALYAILLRDKGYVMPSDALDPSRIIEHQPGCNVLYMGEHGVRARAALTPHGQTEEGNNG